MRYVGFIKDPIHGYIRFTQLERKLIDTMPVQRLRRIRQLAGSEYVYPAANHSRFEHVLGVMYLAGMLGEHLRSGLGERQVQLLRIAGMLHDIGHGPFSHVCEPLMIKFRGHTHEDLVPWLVKETELGDILEAAGYSRNEVGKLAVGRLNDRKRPFLDQVISSAVDVDKMDFVQRDSFHTGAGYGFVDVYRMIYTMDVLDGDVAVDSTAIATLESFVLARLESFRTIYFHRASRAVQIMLVDALEKARDEIGLMDFKDPESFLAHDDYTVWSRLSQSKLSRKIIVDISKRRLIKCAYEKTFFARDELVTSILTKEKVREEIREEISKKAKLAADDVWLDVPSLPSVPYHHSIETKPMDIPIFHRGPSGEKRMQPLSEASRIIEVLRAFMNIVRVYTPERHRTRVGKASTRVLGETPVSGRISF